MTPGSGGGSSWGVEAQEEGKGIIFPKVKG